MMGSDLFVASFSFGKSMYGLDRVMKKWILYAKQYMPNTPMIILGTLKTNESDTFVQEVMKLCKEQFSLIMKFQQKLILMRK